jgi:hypothetical protein
MGASALVPLHARVRALRDFSVAREISTVVTAILTVGRCRHAGPRHGAFIAHDHDHALGLQSAAVLLLQACGGGLPAMDPAGMVAGAAQGHIPPLYARAAPGRGHPLGPGPGPVRGLGLGLSVVLVLVLAHVPAPAPVPHRTLRTLEVVVGPDRTAGAVEAIAGMTSGIADLARHIQKMNDDQWTQLTADVCHPTFLKSTKYTVVVS